MARLNIALILVLAMTPALAYAGADSGIAANSASCSFSEWINAQPGNTRIDENAEKIVLREQWRQNLGIDIFYAYFKAKEVESKVREKTSVRIFRIKGRPEFKNNEAKYIFKTKF
ncbi:MAG: hypothetical protein Q8O12_06200 [Candidatus Omnitrophota bacterium]|nr:hypothetical protein [Candidatus Omnitrophota bacterium]